MEKFCRAGQTIEVNTIWRMRIACWILKATDTHSEYITFIDFPQQTEVIQTRLNGTLYVLHLCFVFRFFRNFTPANSFAHIQNSELTGGSQGNNSIYCNTAVHEMGRSLRNVKI